MCDSVIFLFNHSTTKKEEESTLSVLPCPGVPRPSPVIFTCQYRHSLTVNISVTYNIVCETMSALNALLLRFLSPFFTLFALLLCISATNAAGASASVSVSVSIPPAFSLFRFCFLSCDSSDSSPFFLIQSMGCFLFLAFVFSSISFFLLIFFFVSFLFFSLAEQNIMESVSVNTRNVCGRFIYFLSSVAYSTTQIDSCLSMNMAGWLAGWACVCVHVKKRNGFVLI